MKIAVLSILLSSLNAFAVDTANCPKSVNLKADVTKVYESSKYKNVPGWKTAQASLKSISSFESRFKLVSKNATSCWYRDNDLGTAILMTSEFQDPEETNPVKADQFIVNYKDGAAAFVTFIPLKSYTENGLELYSNPYSLKIKAKLYVVETDRRQNFDMGMISVSVQ